jgi:hypothetical protein
MTAKDTPLGLRGILLVLVLAGCGGTTDAQDAIAACSGIGNSHMGDVCMVNYVNNAQVGRNGEWDTIGIHAQPARSNLLHEHRRHCDVLKQVIRENMTAPRFKHHARKLDNASPLSSRRRKRHGPLTVL